MHLTLSRDPRGNAKLKIHAVCRDVEDSIPVDGAAIDKLRPVNPMAVAVTCHARATEEGLRNLCAKLPSNETSQSCGLEPGGSGGGGNPTTCILVDCRNA